MVNTHRMSYDESSSIVLGKKVKNMKKHHLMAANALALTALVVWVTCSIFVTMFPGTAEMVTLAMLHGRNFAGTRMMQVTPGGFGLGRVDLVAYAWFIGYVPSAITEKLQKRR